MCILLLDFADHQAKPLSVEQLGLLALGRLPYRLESQQLLVSSVAPGLTLCRILSSGEDILVFDIPHLLLPPLVGVSLGEAVEQPRHPDVLLLLWDQVQLQPALARDQFVLKPDSIFCHKLTGKKYVLSRKY